MTIHVYPIDDLINHRLDQKASECDCPCEPTIKWLDDNGEPLSEPIIVHNAIDGRE